MMSQIQLIIIGIQLQIVKWTQLLSIAIFIFCREVLQLFSIIIADKYCYCYWYRLYGNSKMYHSFRSTNRWLGKYLKKYFPEKCCRENNILGDLFLERGLTDMHAYFILLEISMRFGNVFAISDIETTYVKSLTDFSEIVPS